jgi:pilus assembly protein CpaC
MNAMAAFKKGFVCTFFILSFLCLNAAWADNPGQRRLVTENPQKITLVKGKSTIIHNPTLIKRISVASPDVVEAVVLSPKQIYLVGKNTGMTNITLWRGDDSISEIFDVEVIPDLFQLKEKIYDLMPEEKDIRITATSGQITLSGTVSSASNLSQVLSIVGPYAPSDKDSKGPKIINLLQVGGVQQVMLEVRVSEMSRTLLRRLGINFNFVNSSGEFVLSSIANLTQLPTGGGFPTSPLQVSSSVNLAARFFSNGIPWTVFFNALKETGLSKILAEPTLIALSGQQANFLAGGEFPIPSAQGLGTTSVDYKPFGVGLSFTPTVLSNGKINMRVAPEVSELDFSNAVSIGGFFLPSLTTRRVSTTIELADGQSFAIAGLLKDETRETIDKLPLLGDIPILGALFRSTAYQKSETELVIFVTPHLVKPLIAAKQPLPTDQLIDPDDFEFFLLGQAEQMPRPYSAITRSNPAPSKKDSEMSEKFGHIVPKD